MAISKNYSTHNFGAGSILGLLVTAILLVPLIYLFISSRIAETRIEDHFATLRQEGFLQIKGLESPKMNNDETKLREDWDIAAATLTEFVRDAKDFIGFRPDTRDFESHIQLGTKESERRPSDPPLSFPSSDKFDAIFAKYEPTRELLISILSRKDIKLANTDFGEDVHDVYITAGRFQNYLQSDFYYHYLNDNFDRAYEDLSLLKLISNIDQKTTERIDPNVQLALPEMKYCMLSCVQHSLHDNRWPKEYLDRIQKELLSPSPYRSVYYSSLVPDVYSNLGYPNHMARYRNNPFLYRMYPAPTRLAFFEFIAFSKQPNNSFSRKGDSEAQHGTNPYFRFLEKNTTVAGSQQLTNGDGITFGLTSTLIMAIEAIKFNLEHDRWPDSLEELKEFSPQLRISGNYYHNNTIAAFTDNGAIENLKWFTRERPRRRGVESNVWLRRPIKNGEKNQL